jgi:hypothetical protein
MVVRGPHHAAMTFQMAHCVLENICRRQPNNAVYLIALAVAQYRIAQYRDALDTLVMSEEFVQGTPVNLAFRTTACFRLGDKAESFAILDRLVEITHLPPWHQDAETSTFLREAREVISAKTVGKP